MKIHQRIVDFIGEDPVEVNELVQHLQDFRKEKAWKVIEFMQAEDKLKIEKDGRVRLGRR